MCRTVFCFSAQDGILSAAGRIVDRMIELKGMSQDMMKNEFDNATYNNEFQELQGPALRHVSSDI